MQPEEESWNLILDERYKGRIGFFSDGVAIIKVGGLINGVADPNEMTQDEIEAAKETMIQAKPNIRTFWTSQTDAIKEFVAGNIDIMYAWPDAYFTIARRSMPGVDDQYMQPKEGRLAWVCGYVLHKDSSRAGLAHEMMKCIPDAKNAVVADRRLRVRRGRREHAGDHRPGHQPGGRRDLRPRATSKTSFAPPRAGPRRTSRTAPTT